MLRASLDFSSSTLKALRSKGITVLGSQAVPAADGSCLNMDVAYALSDNGCHKLRSHEQVLEMTNA